MTDPWDAIRKAEAASTLAESDRRHAVSLERERCVEIVGNELKRGIQLQLPASNGTMIILRRMLDAIINPTVVEK